MSANPADESPADGYRLSMKFVEGQPAGAAVLAPLPSRQTGPSRQQKNPSCLALPFHHYIVARNASVPNMAGTGLLESRLQPVPRSLKAVLQRKNPTGCSIPPTSRDGQIPARGLRFPHLVHRLRPGNALSSRLCRSCEAEPQGQWVTRQSPSPYHTSPFFELAHTRCCIEVRLACTTFCAKMTCVVRRGQSPHRTTQTYPEKFLVAS